MTDKIIKIKTKMKKIRAEKPFKASIIFLELAVIAYFFHIAFIGILKREEQFFYFAVFTFAIIGLLLAIYGMVEKTVGLARKHLKK